MTAVAQEKRFPLAMLGHLVKVSRWRRHVEHHVLSFEVKTGLLLQIQ